MIKEIMNKNHRLYFNEIAVVPKKNIGYGSAIEFNGLFKIQMDTGECTYLANFPAEEMFQKDIHFSAVYCGGRAFFFPQRGRYISIYTPDTKEFSKIELRDCPYPYFYKHFKIGQAFFFGKKVYAVGASYPYVIVIDSDTLAVKYIPMEIGKKEIMFRAGGCFVGKRFFIPSTVSGVVLSVNLGDDTISLHFLGPNYKGAWAMAYDGRKIWIAPFWGEDVIRAWDPFHDDIFEYTVFPPGYQPGEKPFHRCFFVDGQIYMWPWTANMILGLNPINGEIREIICEMDFSDQARIGCFFIKGTKVYLKKKVKKEHAWYEQDGEDGIFDLRNWKLEKKSFIFSYGIDTFIHLVLGSMKEKLEKGVRESKNFSLEDYIMLLQKNYEETIVPAKERKNNTGAKIYKVLVENEDRR